MTQTGEEPANPSRRRALRLLAVGAAGIGMALLGSEVVFNSKPTKSPEQSATLANATEAGAIQASSIRVKVRYFQMTNVLPGLQVEYFVLAAPAEYRQLLAAVVEKHPAISGMTPTMLVLVNGVVASSETRLNDGDEVDMIPTVSGG